MIVKGNDSTEYLLTGLRDAPASGVWHLAQESSDMEAFEDASQSSALAISDDQVFAVAVEGDMDVSVAKPLKEMRSVQQSTQELDVFAAGGIEAGIGAFVDAFGLRKTLHLTIGGSRIFDNGERVEITCVGGMGDTPVLVEGWPRLCSWLYSACLMTQY